MLSRLFGKKPSSVNEDSWAIATAENDGLPLIFRIRSIPLTFKRSEYPVLIAVTWPYVAADGGMPSQADKERMDILEDLLTDSLESKENAILTVIATGNGIREWQWYSRSQDETMQLVNSALDGHKIFPVEFAIQNDEGWEAYSQFES